MKYLFTTALIVGLASCGTTAVDTPVIPTGDTLQWDTTGVEMPFNTDSIETVSDLLDSLAAVEPAAKMTH